MEWYRPFKKSAAKAPSYLIERISDLNHACDLAKVSPRDANLVLSEVITLLDQQHDDSFISPLKEASRIMHDSPARATDAIAKVVAAMIAEKDLMDSKQEDEKWNLN